tara:strand:+ start:235 stop:537 length:303 start_codon:yes stop_codon:yes gene_type:complete
MNVINNSPQTWIITENEGEFVPYCPTALKALFDFDKSMIGTAGYRGLAYFWAHEYRFYMRDQTPYRRRLIHKHLCSSGLDPAGETRAHLEIIRRFVAANA